jgi:O-acetylserine/cysteine efflux transporter
VVALAVAGTLLPFWLFAYGQARVPAELAGAFLNLEPLVGTAAGWIAFGEAAAFGQLAGVIAVLGGIALSTMPPREDREEPCDDCPPRAPRRLRPLLGAG